jgi:hypothetical protein
MVEICFAFQMEWAGIKIFVYFLLGKSFFMVAFFNSIDIFLRKSFIKIEISKSFSDLYPWINNCVPEVGENIIREHFGPEHSIDFPV